MHHYRLLLFALFTLSARPLTADWHHPLALDGGDYWRSRLPLVITNQGKSSLSGMPLSWRVETEGPGAALIGQAAEQLRVVGSTGSEVLFAVFTVDGEPLRRGPIPDGAQLVIPAECDAESTATCFVYFGNPTAGQVPDYLTARPGLINGSVESGNGDTPDGWQHDPGDATHRVSWTTERPRSGKRCLKTVVAAGAEPTWISTRQPSIHIRGNARYRVTAWVRAQDVTGLAGWYLHIGNDQNPMLTAPMLRAGDGSFDWKQVTYEFTAPAEAKRLDVGTVLRGTGTAWFDDVSLTCLAPGLVRVEAKALERMELTEMGTQVDWRADAADRRAQIAVFNFHAESAADTVMPSIDLELLRRRARGRLNPDSLQVRLDDQPIRHTRFGNSLLFSSTLPPHSVARYQVYFADDALPGDGKIEPPSSLSGMHNLVRNGEFDAGDPLPLDWVPTNAPGGDDKVRLSVDRQLRSGAMQACARMDVPSGLPANWRGWRQSVAVRPGGTYLLAAWLKCAGLGEGILQVHAHRRTSDGQLSKTNPMTSIPQSISGTTDWTFVSGTFQMPADTTEFQIHLTTTASGTVWHDGIVLTEILPGRMAQFECRPLDESSLEIWSVPSVFKLFHDDPPLATTRPFRIAAARNEQEVLQLAIRSGRPVGGVRVRVEPPRSDDGATLPAPLINVLGYVPIDYPTSYYRSDEPAWHRLTPTAASRCDGWPGLWPDPLLPTNQLDLEANTTQAIWITVTVPAGAAPGDYRGRLYFESDGTRMADKEFLVHVWDFLLPSESHVAAIYDVRLGPGGAQQWGCNSLEDVYPDLLRFLARRRLSADTIRPAPKIRYANGRVEADFSQWDKAAAVYFDELHLPHAYTPWTFYLFGWGHPPKTFFGIRPFDGEPPYESADRSRLRPEYKEAYQACLKVFWDHVKEKGWADRMILYISDEPHDRHDYIRVQMKTLCDMIHEVDPTIPIYSSTWRHIPEWDGYLDIWGIGHDGRVPVDKMAELREAGDSIWFTTDGQMCTDTPYCAVERLLPHYCFQYGARAYEFWGASWLTYNPFRYGWHSYIRQSSEPGEYYSIRYPNGDGFLIYPGALIGCDEPISSIRLENAREGVEDYEYLYLLQSLIARAERNSQDVSQARQALAAATQLVKIPNPGGRYSSQVLPNPAAIERVRTQIAAAIESLQERQLP